MQPRERADDEGRFRIGTEDNARSGETQETKRDSGKKICDKSSYGTPLLLLRTGCPEPQDECKKNELQ